MSEPELAFVILLGARTNLDCIDRFRDDGYIQKPASIAIFLGFNYIDRQAVSFRRKDGRIVKDSLTR